MQTTDDQRDRGKRGRELRRLSGYDPHMGEARGEHFVGGVHWVSSEHPVKALMPYGDTLSLQAGTTSYR